MNCRRCTSLLSAYVDDRLDAAERSELDAHVRDCEACAAALRVQRTLSAALRAEPAATPPVGLAERLTRAALGAPTAGERPGLLDRWIPIAWPAAAASAVAAALLLFALGRTDGAPALATDEDPVAAVAGDDTVEDDALVVLAMEEE